MPKQEVKVEKKVGGDTVIDLCSSEDDSDSEVDVIEDVGDEKEVVVLDAHDYVVDPEPSDDDDDDEVIHRFHSFIYSIFLFEEILFIPRDSMHIAFKKLYPFHAA